MSVIHPTYLRPTFTASLAAFLLAGDSIHLISPHGQGRRRTLEDVQHALPSSMQVFYMNMRIYKHDYKNFFNKIRSNHSCFTKQHNDLKSLLIELQKSGQTCLIILHNFDELRSVKDIDDTYDSDFFEALNSINKYRHIALLCVSENRHHHYLLQADGREVQGSELDAQSLHLPELTHTQIMNELKRHTDHLTDSELHEFTASIQAQKKPYTQLESFKKKVMKLMT